MKRVERDRRHYGDSLCSLLAFSRTVHRCGGGPRTLPWQLLPRKHFWSLCTIHLAPLRSPSSLPYHRSLADPRQPGRMPIGSRIGSREGSAQHFDQGCRKGDLRVTSAKSPRLGGWRHSQFMSHRGGEGLQGRVLPLVHISRLAL